MTNPNKEYADRPILSAEEIDDMIVKADRLLPNVYFRLRAKCLIALLKKFGKRRIELARLKRADLKQVNGDLEIEFSLAKKRKKACSSF
jgi:integrase